MKPTHPATHAHQTNSTHTTIGNVRNPWIELTLKNRHARGGYSRAYKHMVKLILNSCGTPGL